MIMRTAMHPCPIHLERSHASGMEGGDYSGNVTRRRACATGVRCASRVCTIERDDNSGDSRDRRAVVSRVWCVVYRGLAPMNRTHGGMRNEEDVR